MSCSEIAIKLMLICRRVAREKKMSKTVNRAAVVYYNFKASSLRSVVMTATAATG